MKHLEDQLQAACVTWFRYQYPDIVIFSVPNGGARDAVTGAMMKKTGTLAGVADLFVMQGRYRNISGVGIDAALGLFIELKAGKSGKQSEGQKAFEQKAKEAGYAYHVCRSIDEFMEVVNNYIK